MQFAKFLRVNLREALRFLGCGKNGPGPASAGPLKKAAAIVERTATPRFTAAYLPLAGLRLGENGPLLTGEDIAAHLEGCFEAALLAVTLGPGPEDAVRRAEVTNIHLAVLLDACASALCQQYTEEAVALLRGDATAHSLYLTGRYSPGYGDFPLAFQHELLRLLDAQTAIGLTASRGGILLPRKSATALLGRATQPRCGQSLHCAKCLVFENCKLRKEGAYCANPHI